MAVPEPVQPEKVPTCVLWMAAQTADGEHLRDPVSFDGLSPQLNPHLMIQRSLLFRDGSSSGHIDVPAFEDLTNSYSRYRMPVGPTLRLAEDHLADEPLASKP